MKVMDLMEMINVPVEDGHGPTPSQDTFFGKLYGLIETSFPGGEFSSSDVAQEFEERYGLPVRLATVSTYLSRLADKNHLRRGKILEFGGVLRAYPKSPLLSHKIYHAHPRISNTKRLCFVA